MKIGEAAELNEASSTLMPSPRTKGAVNPRQRKFASAKVDPASGNQTAPSARSDRSLLPPPGEKEAAAIALATERLAKRTPPVAIANPDTDTLGPIGPEHSDRDGWQDRLCEAFGTSSYDFARCGFVELLGLFESPVSTRAHANAALAMLDRLKPESEVEAMLASQMYAAHALAMQQIASAAQTKLSHQFESSGGMAVKLMRTFTAQVEALAKLRRGGEQTVRVEHVHVYEGGQAVVGNVTHQTTRGGGGPNGNGGQPYAPDDPRAVAFTPGSPLWSENSEGHALPIAEGARSAPVPDARRSTGKRRTARSPERQLSPRLRDQEGG